MVTKANIANYLVVAIDEKLRDYLVSKGYNVYYRDITVSTAPDCLCIDHPVLSQSHVRKIHVDATIRSSCSCKLQHSV